MKQITGTITGIVPAGGYDSRNGYIFTFDMTIKGPNGSLAGEIGSKSEIYPMSVGQTIDVEASKTQHGMRFKKINLDYAERGSSGGGKQSSGQSGGSNKDRLIVAQVVYKVLSNLSDNPHEFDVWLMGNLKIYKRHIDAIMQAGSDELPMPKGGEPNPEYSDNPEPVDTDSDIPF